MANNRFPKPSRLLKSDEFDRVFAQKCSASDARIIIYVAANDVEQPRIGLVVSRKIGNAVVRNRWKRLLREAFRLTKGDLPAGVDLVVLPKPAAEPELERLQASLVQLAHRAAKRLRR
jgi:ribonuclease P protein component